MSAKRMGRPPKPVNQRHVARLEIRLTAADLALIEAAAAGKTSTWARTVLLKAVQQTHKSPS